MEGGEVLVRGRQVAALVLGVHDGPWVACMTKADGVAELVRQHALELCRVNELKDVDARARRVLDILSLLKGAPGYSVILLNLHIERLDAGVKEGHLGVDSVRVRSEHLPLGVKGGGLARGGAATRVYLPHFLIVRDLLGSELRLGDVESRAPRVESGLLARNLAPNLAVGLAFVVDEANLEVGGGVVDKERLSCR